MCSFNLGGRGKNLYARPFDSCFSCPVYHISVLSKRRQNRIPYYSMISALNIVASALQSFAHMLSLKKAQKKPSLRPADKRKREGAGYPFPHLALASLSLLGLREWRFLSLPFPVCVCIRVCCSGAACNAPPSVAGGGKTRGSGEETPLGSPPLSDRRVTRAHRKENVGASAVRPPARL